MASRFPAASLALTKNVWEPFARPTYIIELVQVDHTPPSRLHSKVRPEDRVPLSVPLKLNTAVLELLGLDGEAVMLVSGGVASSKLAVMV